MADQASIAAPGAEADPDFDRVHARLLRFLPDLVKEHGGDLRALLDGTGVRAAMLRGGRAEISYRQAVELLAKASAMLDCADFGMQLALRQSGGGMFGPLGRVMRNSKTFGDALEYVTRHNYAHSLAARVTLRPIDKGLVLSSHEILLDNIGNRAQAMEQILLVGHLEAMNMTGGHARARRIYFRHQPLSTMRVYRRYFGCEVRFGEAIDGLAFSPDDLSAPILSPDDEALAEATDYIDRNFTRHRPPVHAEVRGVVMRRLAAGGCSNAQVARALGLHLRTLRRRLADEGTTFRQVKDEVRRDVMLYYLRETDLDLTAISERLGFAEQSIMTRKCRAWFGMAPTRLRRQAREDAD